LHTTTFSSTFVSDSSTRFAENKLLFGTFAFTNGTSLNEMHIVGGCHRLPEFPWYLQPFQFWSQFVTVPAFSVLSSLATSSHGAPVTSLSWSSSHAFRFRQTKRRTTSFSINRMLCPRLARLLWGYWVTCTHADLEARRLQQWSPVCYFLFLLVYLFALW
jgi:hypothetical protein